ncbi:MAG: DUF3526 domain-containing protein [Gammaproteobacteria bacterium]|nr:DUF3526 domain-containing protein [Gammaproteobacteria bacterium]
MSTLAVILRHELTSQWRDGRARAIVVIALLLLAVAAAVSVQQHAQMAEERHHAHEAEWQRWLDQPARNPHSAAHYGFYVFKPAPALGLLDPGLDPYLGISTWLEAHWMNDFIHRPAQDQGVLSRFPALNPAQLVQTVLPLLLIFLGFASLSGERAQGTLGQLLSLGVAPTRLALGKLLGTSFWLLLTLLPALLIAALGLALGPDGGEEVPLRFALWLVFHLLYLGGWAVLVLGVSARLQTPRGALTTLLTIWLLVCWILPRIATEVAAVVQPLPSTAEWRIDLQASLGESHSSERALRVRERVLAEYGVERTEDLPIDWRGISLQEEEEANYPIFDQHFGALFDGYRSQERLLQQAGFLIPALAVQSVSQALAGTDLTHHRAFVFAAEAHRRVIQELMNHNVTLYDREGTDYRADPELWATVPEFAYRPPGLLGVLAEVRWAMLALLLWAGVTATFAYLQVRSARP